MGNVVSGLITLYFSLGILLFTVRGLMLSRTETYVKREKLSKNRLTARHGYYVPFFDLSDGTLGMFFTVYNVLIYKKKYS